MIHGKKLGINLKDNMEHLSFSLQLCSKKNPPSLSDKDRNFRNNIIHKGQIAKKEETLDYCSKILEIESYCFDKIFKRFEEVEKQYRRHLNKERESKGNPKIAYINWEPVGHIFNKTTMEKDLTIEKILTRA